MSARCPICDSSADLRPSTPRGPVERWFLPLFGYRLLRCARCGHRFRNRGEVELPAPPTPQPMPRPDGGTGPDQTFEELLQDLRQTERRMFSESSKTKRAS